MFLRAVCTRAISPQSMIAHWDCGWQTLKVPSAPTHTIPAQAFNQWSAYAFRDLLTENIL